MTSPSDARPPRALAYADRWIRSRGRALLDGVRPHLALYALALATYAAGLVQTHLLGEPLAFGLTGLISMAVLMVIVGVICVHLAIGVFGLWRSGYEGSPTVAALRMLLDDILTPGRVANGFHAILATGIFAIGFTTLKTNIPRINPFSWDEAFMQLDRLTHFGVLPHELLAPLFQHPPVTFAINLIYNFWFLMLMGFFLWQGCAEKNTPLRQHFLLAYLACWALGTGLFGTLFSSAGPCYYGHVVAGDDPYAGLMDYLRATDATYPIWALATQDMLWDAYATSKGVISGISAMPSMHVGTSVLFFLCARASGIGWLTWLTGLFAVAIQLGSVLLGWHYAVDGYAGALIALACWWLAGLWVKRTPLSSRPS